MEGGWGGSRLPILGFVGTEAKGQRFAELLRSLLTCQLAVPVSFSTHSALPGNSWFIFLLQVSCGSGPIFWVKGQSCGTGTDDTALGTYMGLRCQWEPKPHIGKQNHSAHPEINRDLSPASFSPQVALHPYGHSGSHPPMLPPSVITQNPL